MVLAYLESRTAQTAPSRNVSAGTVSVGGRAELSKLNKWSTRSQDGILGATPCLREGHREVRQKSGSRGMSKA